MKNLYYILGFILLTLAGCLDDEGVYEYEKIEEPSWNTDQISLTVRSGDIVKFRASNYFNWTTDSLKRAGEVRYEWKYNNVILGDKPDFDVLADEIIQKCKITKFDGNTKIGTFSIIEKESGVTFMLPVHFKFHSTYTDLDWFILSEKGGNSKLSLLKRTINGRVLEFSIKDDLYHAVNGEDMTGKPLSMTYASGATNIGALGSITVKTDQETYEINCENVAKVSNLEEIPIPGKIVLRKDIFDSFKKNGMQSFVTDQNGQMYRRIMSKNNLGGSFESIPMFFDEKGYNITHFGQGLRIFNSWMVAPYVPCYDALNRRMLLIEFYDSGIEYDPNNPEGTLGKEKYKLSRLKSTAPAEGIEEPAGARIWNMPVGTTPLHIWNAYDRQWYYYAYFRIGMVYNDAAGKTRLTFMATDYSFGNVTDDGYNMDIPFPGGDLTEDACILTSMNGDGNYQKSNYILYSKGNEIRYVYLSGKRYADKPYITLEDPEDKVTFMKWSLYHAVHLMVGTEKGKLYIFDDRTKTNQKLLPANPKLLKEFDLGSKIVDGIEISAGEEYYESEQY